MNDPRNHAALIEQAQFQFKIAEEGNDYLPDPKEGRVQQVIAKKFKPKNHSNNNQNR